MSIALNPSEIEDRRRERARRLALHNIPLMRVVGSVFLTLGVILNDRFLMRAVPLRPWWEVAAVLAVYAFVAWAAVRVTILRSGRDLTLFFLAGDVVVWTFAIYATGAEQSWLFFILVLRVADQMQTTVRRCLAFALWGVACYAAMRGYVALVDGRPVNAAVFMTKLTFIAVSGVYVAIAAKTSESRRAQMAAAIRLSRDLIREREEAVARAEEASAAKSDFLASMSHEMRTPLHGVIGMLQLAHDGETSPQRIRQLEMARRSAESLLGTIDDILDFSKIEARRIELEPVYYHLRQVMHDTMKPLGITAAAKGLALAYLVGEEVPDAIWGDPLRLRQILVNLVGNATKFTESGEIAVRVSAARHDDRNLQLRFEVRDTGVGIDPAKHGAIFQPFTQIDPSRASGTGLGLAIVSRLIEAMGGSIDVESSPGKGSAFHFTIATETDAFAAPLRPPWEAMLAGRSMLVIDPHRMSRAFIAEMLRSRDIFATACASAGEAPRGARYALTITSDPSSATERFIVISSPLAAAHLEFPHVTRPVSERELFDAIGIAIGVTRPAAVIPPPQWQQARGPHLRVLVVEDHPINQEFAAEALRRLGHDVSLASNGFEAVAKVERERFDAVLMDIQMPGINGIEATKRLRATDNGRRARVIAMTAFTRKEDRDRCLEAGVDAVLTKPVNVSELAAALRWIEPDRLLETVGGNVRLLARVTAAFVQQTPPLIAAMQEAITAGDAGALHDSAHKLKGSVSNFETTATELAQEIEDCAERGELARAATVMPHLERALRDLEKRLSAATTSA